MTIQVDGTVIRVRGASCVEDAEALLALIQAPGSSPVDIGDAIHLHAAVIQVLLAFKPSIVGDPADGFLSRFVAPMLESRPPTPGAPL
jgi:hypothetical protein